MRVVVTGLTVSLSSRGDWKGGFMSGYVHCACRDCFEVAIANEGEESSTLCSDCEDCGCDSTGKSECADHLKHEESEALQ